MVKRVLRKYGYPPDLEDVATDLVLQQAELIAGERAGYDCEDICPGG